MSRTLGIIYILITVLFFYSLPRQFSVPIFQIIILLFSLTLLIIICGKKKKKLIFPIFYLLFPFFILIAARGYILLKNDVPLGYDTGFYKAEFELHYEYAVNGKNEKNILYNFSNIFYNLKFNTDFILYIVYSAFAVILFGSLYILSKNIFNSTAAIFVCAVFSISFIESHAFWHMLFRHMFFLPFLICTFYFIYRKSHLSILTGAVSAFYPPTLFILMGALVLSAAFNKERKFYIISGGVIFILGILLSREIFFYIKPFFESFPGAVKTFSIYTNIFKGNYMDMDNYKKLAFIYLPFSLLGIVYWTAKKKLDLIASACLISILMVFLKLIIYQRFIIYFDIFAVIFAGYMFYEFTKRLSFNIYEKLTLIFFITTAVATQFIFISKLQPLITGEELNEIISLKDIEPEAYIMSTHKYYTPWLKGYSGHRNKIISPKYLENDLFTQDEWFDFWLNESNIKKGKMLKRYNAPVYVYIGEKQEKINLREKDGFRKHSRHIWKFYK